MFAKVSEQWVGLYDTFVIWLGEGLVGRLVYASQGRRYFPLFRRMRIAEYGKLSRVICGKLYADFFFWGMKGKVRNESMRNVAGRNIY